MRRRQRYFSLLIVMSGLLLFFNNCSPFRSGEGSSGDYASTAYQSVCEGQLKAAFQRTYHPFLTKNCNLCHSTAHGSADLSTSYNAFKLRGETLIDYQSTHAHGGNNFTTAMQAEINVFKPGWTDAQTSYANCLAAGAAQGDGKGPLLKLKTTGKAVPNLMNTLNNNNWVGVEWDLESEVELRGRNRIKAILRFEAKAHQINGSVAGLLLRNPTMKLKSGSQNVAVDGVMIYVNDVKQTAVTTYSGLSQIVNLTTPVKLVAESGSAYVSETGLGAGTLLGFEFNEIKNTNQVPDVDPGPVAGTPVPVPIPDVPIPSGGVTHSQLNNSTSPYRVFNRSCTGCHNSGSGRLDLTNYEAARAAAATIIQRMNSTTSPMPPTGRLRANDRDMVQSWVNAGTPR